MKYKTIKIYVFVIVILCLPLFLPNKLKHARPNILLITIDALRADHLGCYGYGRDTSPNIDRLAKEGTVFLNCFSTGPGTAYSFVGLLTGRYLAVGKEYVFLDNILGREFITLPEYLKDYGYYTAAFVLNGNLMAGKGFEQGFDYYRDSWHRNDANGVTDGVLEFLKNYRGNRPFFIWVHYIDTHSPYTYKEESFKLFGNDSLYRENDRMLLPCPDTNMSIYTSAGYIPRVVFHKDKYNLNYYIASYDGEALFVDSCLGELFKNVSGDTMVILSADHGESFGEHGCYFSHEESIYDAALHVPLIIRDSSFFRGGRRIAEAVSCVDIVPTVLAKVDPGWYRFNKERFNGLDLKAIAKGALKRKYIYSYFPWAYSIRDVEKNVKYMLREDGKEELYFLPDESVNRMADFSEEALCVKSNLKEALDSWLKDFPVRADTGSKRRNMGDDEKEKLRSLGYMQ